jgi:4-hydroxy-3-methylbut-2-enyl diphosphate reductase
VYGDDNFKHHFADTRDTLCYATNDNQQATYGLLESEADLAFVIGGYNSSNTSHLVELCEEKLPTYFINTAREIENASLVHHWNIHKNERVHTENFLPAKRPLRIILTSGASCPDALVEEVMYRLLEYFPNHKSIEEAIEQMSLELDNP